MDAEAVLDESIDLANGIQRALYEFDSTSNHTLLRLYHRVDVSATDSRASMTSADDNPNPLLSGSDSEHIFLVYLYVTDSLLPGVVSADVLRSEPALYSRCRSSRVSSFRLQSQ